MYITKAEQKLLELNGVERAIIDALEKREGATVLELSRALALPRTSIYWPLSQLEGRGLVTYELVGKRKRWISRLGEAPIRKQIGSLESVAGDVRIFEGIEQLREVYMFVFALHEEERATIVEGTNASLSLARKGGIPFMKEWHEKARKKKLVLENIIGAKIYAGLKRGLIDAEIVESLTYLTRWIVYVVPDELIDTDSALIVFRDSAILADWEKERAVLINNREIVFLLRKMIDALTYTGKKIDIGPYIRAAHATRKK